VYAIVRCGGRQEKASVDDVLTVDKLAGDVGSSVTFPAVLVVDDDNIVSDPAAVGSYQVTGEIMGPVSGPKISMILYKNKTGYRRRLGHRQKYTQVRITDISVGGSGKSSTTKASTSKASTAKASPAKAAAKDGADKAAPKAKAAASKPAAAKTSAAKTSKTSAAKADAGKASASSGKKD